MRHCVPGMAFEVGEKVGSYRIVRLLGQGGMGDVYEVEHVELGTHYALKAFACDYEEAEMLRRKFLDEGRSLARLEHPNVVRVFDLAVEPETGMPYFVMDLVLYEDGEGDGLTAESGMIDIATMKPREAVPFLIGDAEKIGSGEREYEEDFSALAGLTKATSAKEVDLPNWQFFKGDDETETLLFAANEKATTGGVYAMLDDAKSEGSAALGTLATSLAGAAIGIAFSNDCPFAAANFTLAFDSVQRTFKAAGKSYVFEYLVTDGETRIDTEGEWVPVKIDETAPLTAEDATEQGTDSKRISGFPIDLDVTVRPGQVLLLRWRDQKRDSKNGGASPLMGIDNVRLNFQMMGQKGFGIIMR